MIPENRPERDELPGLQAERTSLAWERAALAALVNGGLLLLLHLQGGGAALVVAGCGLVLAMGLAETGRARARQIRTPGGAGVVARLPVLISCTAVIVFGLVVLVVLGFGGRLM